MTENRNRGHVEDSAPAATAGLLCAEAAVRDQLAVVGLRNLALLQCQDGSQQLRIRSVESLLAILPAAAPCKSATDWKMNKAFLL